MDAQQMRELRDEAAQYAAQALSASNREWYTRVVSALDHANQLREALCEIANRASNMADDDAAEWMPSIYAIAVKTLGDDPMPFLKAVGLDKLPGRNSYEQSDRSEN
jgi:hypothetical protein